MLSVLVGAELQHSDLLPWGGFPISPGAYIFQRPFLRGLFLEGLMYDTKFVFPSPLG